MLAIPTVGMARSVPPQHGVELDALCDWIEASLSFDEMDFISGSNVVDALCDDEVYSDQNFAWELVERAWAEFERRQTCMGKGAPFKVDGQRVVRLCSWKDCPAHAFCLALACAKWYPQWAESVTKNYTDQGELFEALTVASLGKLLPNWTIHRTGWSPDNAKKLKDIIRSIADMLVEPHGELEPWIKDSANEAGLDVVCFRAFGDRRPNLPTYFVQCASGKHYDHKLTTPDLNEWSKVIRFISRPQRSFATPFAFTENEFKRTSNKVSGLMLDRCRLLSAGCDGAEWIDDQLKAKLCRWIKPRISKLERAQA